MADGAARTEEGSISWHSVEARGVDAGVQEAPVASLATASR